MLASSLCMYNVEHDVQPDVFDNAFSGLWWSVSTILTVGYGDIYPVTVLGKAMAIVISLLGVGVVAVPTGIISAGFVEQHSKLENETLINKVSETNTLLKEANLSSASEACECQEKTETILSPNENLIERIMRDRANTDPETRKLFDNYLAEIFRD